MSMKINNEKLREKKGTKKAQIKNRDAIVVKWRHHGGHTT